jgi:hypothetical protein
VHGPLDFLMTKDESRLPSADPKLLEGGEKEKKEDRNIESLQTLGAMRCTED